MDQESLQKTVPGGSGPIVPQSYTFVPPVCRNLVTQPPIKVGQPVTRSSFDEEKQHEQAWMTAVQDTLYVDSNLEKKNTPTMWSSFHAAQSDAVGQPTKSIQVLLPLFHEKAATPEMIRHGMELVKKTSQHLNPHQVPVLVVDQLFYDLAKKCSGLSLISLEKTSLW